MKSSDIKVLNVKSKYNLSDNKNEFLTKQATNLERKPLIYNNTNHFNDNNFFLDNYEIINWSNNVEENQDFFNNKNVEEISSSFNETKIANPTKLARIVQKQPIFPLKNDEGYYINANSLMQYNNQQLDCSNCSTCLSINSNSSLFNKSGNDRFNKKIAKINAKTNYYRAKYEQFRVKKQLQIDWKCCSKHLKANCDFELKNKNDFQTRESNNLTDFDQQQNQLILKPSQNEILTFEPESANSDNIEYIGNNDKTVRDFIKLEQDLSQDTNEINSLTKLSASEKEQDILNSLVENNEQRKDNKLQINFVATNPNEKRKIKHERKIKENPIDELELQAKKNEAEDDFGFDLFADFDEPISIDAENNSSKINSLSIPRQEIILSHDEKKKSYKTKKQDKSKTDFVTNKVITWNSFSNVSLKIILVATIGLAICLGLIFQQQINSSETQWNIMWFLNKDKNVPENKWLVYIYKYAFLIASAVYSIIFIIPLIIFGRKKMFITSLAMFLIGLGVWTAFACLGFFKYSTFKVNKIIASLEATSLIVSWIVFTSFLFKLIKYNKQVKIKNK